MVKPLHFFFPFAVLQTSKISVSIKKARECNISRLTWKLISVACLKWPKTNNDAVIPQSLPLNTRVNSLKPQRNYYPALIWDYVTISVFQTYSTATKSLMVLDRFLKRFHCISDSDTRKGESNSGWQKQAGRVFSVAIIQSFRTEITLKLLFWSSRRHTRNKNVDTVYWTLLYLWHTSSNNSQRYSCFFDLLISHWTFLMPVYQDLYRPIVFYSHCPK